MNMLTSLRTLLFSSAAMRLPVQADGPVADDAMELDFAALLSGSMNGDATVALDAPPAQALMETVVEGAADDGAPPVPAERASDAPDLFSPVFPSAKPPVSGDAGPPIAPMPPVASPGLPVAQGEDEDPPVQMAADERKTMVDRPPAPSIIVAPPPEADVEIAEADDGGELSADRREDIGDKKEASPAAPAFAPPVAAPAALVVSDAMIPPAPAPTSAPAPTFTPAIEAPAAPKEKPAPVAVKRTAAISSPVAATHGVPASFPEQGVELQDRAPPEPVAATTGVAQGSADVISGKSAKPLDPALPKADPKTAIERTADSPAPSAPVDDGSIDDGAIGPRIERNGVLPSSPAKPASLQSASLPWTADAAVDAAPQEVASPVRTRSEVISLLQMVREQFARPSPENVRAAEAVPATPPMLRRDAKPVVEDVDIPAVAIRDHASVSAAPPTPPAVQTVAAAVPAVTPPPANIGASLDTQVIDMGVSGQWIDGLARDIAGLAQNGAHGRFQINGDQLGPVQVDIRQGAGGAAVSLTVASEAAELALKQDSDRLRLDAGLAAVRISDVKIERAPHIPELARADAGQSATQQQQQQGQQSSSHGATSAWQGSGQGAGQGSGQGMAQSERQGQWQARENSNGALKGNGDGAVINQKDASGGEGARRARYA